MIYANKDYLTGKLNSSKLDDDTNTENSTEVETKKRGRKPKTTLAEEG